MAENNVSCLSGLILIIILRICISKPSSKSLSASSSIIDIILLNFIFNDLDRNIISNSFPGVPTIIGYWHIFFSL